MSRLMDEMRKEAADKASIEKATENALSMLKDNVPLEKISKYSGISIEEVEKLKQEMQKKNIVDNGREDINSASTKIIDEANLYALKNGVSEMSLEEINEEIRLYRKERAAKSK